MSKVRDRRLGSDFAAAQAMAMDSHGRLRIEVVRGDPPESYVFVFRCRSLVDLTKRGPVYADSHRVRIQLTAEYPATPPFASMLSPLVHPHVWPNRTICLGVWNPTEKLDSVLGRIGSILTYDPAGLNWRSVVNDVAASWAQQHLGLLPLDRLFAPSAVFALSRS